MTIYDSLMRDTGYLVEEIAWINDLPVLEVSEILINDLDGKVERVIYGEYTFWKVK
ncbi:MAG: hypothetical protein ACRENZ_01165 [Thermodesulfobacteriota bacterium]